VSAVVRSIEPTAFAPHAPVDVPSRSRGVAIVVLGTGVVGSALLRLLATTAASDIRVVGVANSSRQLCDARGFASPPGVAALALAPAVRDDDALLCALDASDSVRRVIVDATGSSATAALHARWLDAGYDVVTASKDAAAAPASRWRALREAASRGRAYGDSATVGAGLPVLSTLRRLRACGDALVALEGVFSGSLSWLFNRYDGTRTFSALLREARAWGYTEPDPRFDLSGIDVARKVVILARAAGRSIDLSDVAVESLVPDALRGIGVADFLENASLLDDAIARRFAEATARVRVLRYVASIDANGEARVGLVEVAPSHPAARLSGTDNLFALTTTRYRAQPLVIQGPGAGAEVTAQALLGDLIALRDA
jgi:aspartokinase/homoserine dehydrogenase 1